MDCVCGSSFVRRWCRRLFRRLAAVRIFAQDSLLPQYELHCPPQLRQMQHFQFYAKYAPPSLLLWAVVTTPALAP